MTNEEIESLKDRIHSGMRMVMDIAEKIGKENKEWTIDEVSEMSDIVKDMSESLKNIAKTHHLLSEHSMKTF